jgi:hypothetical protein
MIIVLALHPTKPWTASQIVRDVEDLIDRSKRNHSHSIKETACSDAQTYEVGLITE